MTQLTAIQILLPAVLLIVLSLVVTHFSIDRAVKITREQVVDEMTYISTNFATKTELQATNETLNSRVVSLEDETETQELIIKWGNDNPIYTNAQGDSVVFKVFYDPMTWYQARDECSKYGSGASLAAVYSDEENQMINQLGKLAWIGGNAIESENDWRWVQGINTADEVMSYTNWMANEPNAFNGAGGGPYCVMRYGDLSDNVNPWTMSFEFGWAYNSYLWNDNVCIYPHPYICQIRF